MKRQEPQSIRQVIDGALTQLGQRDSLLQWQAGELWPDIVGTGINRYTTRRYVGQDGVMHVYMTSAVIKQELMMCRTELAAAINKRLGKEIVREIIFH